jgi:tRNA1Val (adenine37-N6)-methyltransferase
MHTSPVQVFNFKKFRCYNDSCHKIGTDSILLGAWVCRNFKHAPVRSILDIGTGSGVLALMLAQDFHRTASIDAVEVDGLSASVAAQNFQDSGWAANLQLHHCTFQGFAQQTSAKYDLVVSNPPFFPATRSTQPPDLARAIARQGMLLPYDDLVLGSLALMTSAGSLCVVLPTDEAASFVAIAQRCGLFLKRRLLAQTTPLKPARRHVMEFVPYKTDFTDELHVIHTASGRYSEEHQSLTRDFYTIF